MDQTPRSGPWLFKTRAAISGVVLLLGLTLIYFSAWQVGVAATLIAIGIYVWWRARQPDPTKTR
jgi:hypothetical protein